MQIQLNEVSSLGKIRRINVVGTSGSGKSTTARAIAVHMNVSYIEMDALFWGPNWSQPSDDVFAERVATACRQEAWVLDGNYTRTVPIKWQNVDLIVWVDTSFARTVFQAVKRAFTRIWTGEELWPGTGNRETLRKFFGRGSILLWTLKTYHRNREKYLQIATDPEGEFSHLKFVRIKARAEQSEFLRKLPTQIVPMSEI